MTNINQLSSSSSLAGSDQIVVWSGENGDTRKASLSTLTAFFEENFASPEFEVQTAAPTSTGFTVTLDDSTNSIWLIMSPTGTFATGTIVLPPVADCFDGQQIIVISSQVVTALTVNGNGATVNGAPTALAVNGFFTLRFRSLTSTWYCVAQSLGGTTTFSDITITLGIKGSAGHYLIQFLDAASAVNNIAVLNANTGSNPVVQVTGTDANIGLTLLMKGTGEVSVNGTDQVVLKAATQTLTNKTLTTPIVAGASMILFGTTPPRFQTVTVAALPAAAGNQGGKMMVSDSNAAMTAGIGAVVAAGGANIVPVYSDGTNWRIG